MGAHEAPTPSWMLSLTEQKQLKILTLHILGCTDKSKTSFQTVVFVYTHSKNKRFVKYL